jgi:hypothetical protein
VTEVVGDVAFEGAAHKLANGFGVLGRYLEVGRSGDGEYGDRDAGQGGGGVVGGVFAEPAGVDLGALDAEHVG